MEVSEIIINCPRNRSTALNQAAYFYIQADYRERRKENLMSNIKNTQNKLKRLEATLDNYNNQLQELNQLDADFNKKLKELQDQWSLTQAEILETKSSLLRNQIEGLKAKIDIQETGRSRNF